MVILWAKIKKKIVCRTRPTVRKRWLKIFFCMICDDIFLFFVTGNRDRKFRYCSRIYVQNWFTLLNEQNLLLDFEGTRFVNEQSILKKKKSPYLPTHRWNGGSGAGIEHIFLTVALIVLDQHLGLDFIVIGHWINSPQVDVLHHQHIILMTRGSVCSSSLLLHAKQKTSEYQFYCLLIDPMASKSEISKHSFYNTSKCVYKQ